MEKYEQIHGQSLVLEGLIEVARRVFPEIIFMNLTKATCRMVQTTMNMPVEGDLDQTMAILTKGVAPEDREAFRHQFSRDNLLEAFRNGKDRIQLTYRRHTVDESWNWIETMILRRENPYDDDILAYSVSRNVDQQKVQEERLRQALADSAEERLKEKEAIFNIVSQHSQRMLYIYDLATRTTRPWGGKNDDRDLLEHLYTGVYNEEALENNSAVLPESQEDTRKFFADIHSGIPSGESNIHIKMAAGRPRWYHFTYSLMFDRERPSMALISVEDITERHEHELAYLRHVQSVISNVKNHLIYMESCLVCDRVENLSGHILSEEESANVRFAHSEFGRMILDKKFKFEDAAQSSQYFSCDNLLSLYHRGERHVKSEWKVRFHDDTVHWLGIEVALMEEPFNGHVKAFTSIMDITEEQEEQQSLLQRADYDAMTGLLRRGIGEAKIREYLSARKKPGGILIALDLDDLKGINDTLGHAHGDKAIMGIANTLKSHFRKGDILIRAGGDEFLVFLPEAGNHTSAVELSVEALLQELSMISVGDNDERRIHCSIGCAVQLPGTDTFDSLYQRADMALYHVKRAGKNNYAFFEPMMLEENYRFKTKQARPVLTEAAKEKEMQHLLEVVSMQYPGVVYFNLTKNGFRILAAGSDVESVHAPDKVDIFWKNWRKNIHPEDWENVISNMSRNALLEQYAQGQRRITHYYRNKGAAGYVRTEVDIRLYAANDGDISAFLFFRWDDKEEAEGK